jgi:hypothetical protein
MEIAKMNYYFTGLLIILICLLALFVEPAYPRNEYLNEYGVRCGEVDLRVEQRNRDTDYRTSNSSDYDDDSQNFSITFRKYLGTDCKTSKENVAIKQQLELMKMCGRVNSNPSLAYNSNFDLLVSKCRGVTPTRDNTRPNDSKSHWDNLKDGYKKENPNLKLMGDSKLLIPPKDFELPVPKSEEDEWNEIE